MTAKGEHFVTIEGSADKRSIIGTFAIPLDSNLFLVAVQHKFYRGWNFQKILASAQIPNIFQTRMNCLGSWNESSSLM